MSSQTRPLPLYAALTKELTDRIAHGTYSVGDLLPTEPQLTVEFGVSRQTVREAIRRLADQGLVSRQPGIGTRVQKAVVDTRYSYQMTLSSDLTDYAREVPLTVDSIDPIVANNEMATFLSCRPNTKWLRVQGRRRHVGESMALAVSDVFLRDKYPGIEVHLRKLDGPIHVVLQECYGEIIEEVKQEMFAVALDEPTAALLGVPAGSPAMELRRRFYGTGDRLVISGRVISSGDSLRYAASFRRDTKT